MRNLELLNFGKKYLIKNLFVALVFCLPVSGFAAAISSAAVGDWSNTATWIGGVVPVAGDDVTINHAVTVTANAAAKSVTVNAAGDFTVNAGVTLTLDGAASTEGFDNKGTTNNNGTITVTNSTSTSGALATTGLFNNNAGAIFNADGSGGRAVNVNGTSGVLNNAGTLNVGANASINWEAIFLYGSGTFNNTSTGVITVENTTSRVMASQSPSTFNNDGLMDLETVITNNGFSLKGDFNNLSNGVINIGNCSSEAFRLGTGSGSLVNQGVINAGTNSPIGQSAVLGYVTFDNQGTFNIDNFTGSGLNILSGTASNSGTINVGQNGTAGTYGVYTQVNFPNTGTVIVDGVSTAGVGAVSGTFQNDGLVVVGENIPGSGLVSGPFSNNSLGTLRGSGTIRISGFVHNGGTIQPEFNAASSIYGIHTYNNGYNVTETFDCDYEFDIGGTMTPGVDFDQYVRDDSGTSSGEDISNMNAVFNLNYTPSPGDLIHFWDGKNRTGTFASVSGLSGGLSVGYDVPNAGDISLVYPGPATALNFDGVDDHTDVDVPALPQGKAPRSVEAWVRTTQTNIGNIVSWGTNSSSQKNSIAVRFGKFAFFGRFNDLIGTTTINDGQWHHVAMTYDGTTMNLYVDGVLDISQNKNLNTTGTTLIMGKNATPTNDEYFEGDIDEVRIWGYERSLSELTTNKDCELDGTQCGLTVYHNFNQGMTYSNNTSIPWVNELVDGKDASLINFASTGGSSNWVSGAANGVSGSCSADPCSAASALNFDGTNDYIDVPTATGLPQTTEERTVEAWVKTTQTSIGNIVSWGTYNTSQRNSLAVQSGRLAFIGRFNDMLGTTTINNGVWHHVAMTYDGVTMKLYVDGVEDASQTKTLNTTGDELFIGKNASPSFNEYFQGDIDEVRIWDFAQCATDLAGNKDCELAGTEAGLIVYYNFNQGVAIGNNSSEIVAFDNSLNGYDGDLLDFALNGAASNWSDGSGNGVTGGCGTATCSTEIDVEGNMVSIADGDTTPDVADDTDFGNTTLGTPVTKTFTIFNDGMLTLNIIGAITVDNTTDFSVTQPALTAIPPSGSTTFTVTYNAVASGSSTATITIPNNDSNENPYDFDVKGEILVPEINVKGNSTDITDGDTTPDTGDHTDFDGNFTRTFTIENTGMADLNISGVTFSGANAADFSVTSSPTSPVVASGSTTFEVTFSPSSTGLKNATIEIANDDSDENQYDFAITATGIAASALDFDGTNDYVEIPHDASLNPNSHGLTLEAWVYVSSTANQQIFHKWLVNQYTLEINSGKLTFVVGLDAGGTDFIRSTNNFPTNQWVHVAGTYDGTELRVYENGILTGSKSQSGALKTSASGILRLGARSNALTEFIDGPMDEVRIWNRGLCQAEIQAQKDCELAGTETGLIAYYDFNQGIAGGSNSSETTLTDRAGSNDGTLTNFALSGITSNWIESTNGVTGGCSYTAPEIAVDTASVGLDFGNVTINTTSTKTFTITNSGNGTLTINSITSDDAKFVISNFTAGSTAASGGGTVTFDVDFMPTATGIQSALISIDNDDCDENPYEFTITGTGVVPEIDVEGNMISIADGDTTPDVTDDTDFGSTNLGTPVTKTFTIFNDGTGNLNITGAITVDNTTDFSVTQPALTAIPPSGSTTFTVTYNAATIGSQTATVNIPNDDADEDPYDFVVKGEILVPEIDVQGNGMSIVDGDTTPDVADDTDFGSTAHTNTVTKTFTIENTGTSDLNITGNITLSNSTDFTVTQPSVTLLIPTATTTFDVTYNALSLGTQSAIVNIPNDDTDENPYDFTVEGTTTGPFSYCVSNLNDSGAGSLRQAILDANATAGEDVINFCIGGIIEPTTDLPDITEGVLIDGTSAPGYVLGTPTVTIRRAISGDINSFALVALLATNITIQGLSFSNSTKDGNGIYLNSCTNAVVQDNLILNRDLAVQAASGSGVTIINNDLTGSGSYAARPTIHLSSTTVTDISMNIYGGGGTALRLQTMSNVTIGDLPGNDIVFESGSGLDDMGGGASGNEPVVSILSSSNISFDGVDLSSNAGTFTGEGLSFVNCSGTNTITNCNIQFRKRGIYAAAPGDYIITNNDVSNSGFIFNSPAISIDGLGSITASGNIYGGISETAWVINNMPNLTIGSAAGNDIVLEDGMGLEEVATGNNPVIQFTISPSFTIDDVIFSNGSGIKSGYGIGASNCTGTNTIINCDFEHRNRGVSVFGGGDVVITGNNFLNTGLQKLHAAIHLDGLNGLTANSNVFGGIGNTAMSLFNMIGVDIGSSGAFDVLFEPTSGLDLVVASGTEPVLYFDDCSSISIDGVDLSGNAGAGTGVFFKGGNSNLIRNSLINNRNTGLIIEDGTGIDILCNTLTNLTDGFVFNGAPSINLFTDNGMGCISNFAVDNNTGSTIISEGNYWEDHTGPSNLGGIGLAYDGTVDADPFLDKQALCAPDGIPYCPDMAPRPEIDVEGNMVTIANGDTTPDVADDTDFGDVSTAGSDVHTFTVENTGTADLTISSITIGNMTDFAVSGISGTPITAGSSETFTVTFNPTTTGLITTTVTINNNDADENPYTFDVQGTGGDPAAALDFDGINDVVEITNNQSWAAAGTSFTIECWVNSTDPSTLYNSFITNYGSTAPRTPFINLGFTNDLNEVFFGLSDVSGTENSLAVPLNTVMDGNWHHLACVRDAATSNMYFYVDGVLTGVTSAPMGNVGFASTISIMDHHDRYTEGKIDEVRIWDVARSCEEISHFKDCELAGTETGIVAYHQFNQGVASGTNTGLTTLTDITGNGNDGTLMNFTLSGSASNWVTPGGVMTGNSCSGSPTGPEIAVDTTSVGLDFGNVTINTTSTKTFTITNSGNGTLTINSITSDDAKFVISNFTAGSTVASGGGTVTFDVDFMPTATDVQSALISIDNDDCDENPYEFTITGTGVVPEIDVEGNMVSIADGDTTPDVADDTDFGSTTLGTPVTKTFTIYNDGMGDLDITGSITVDNTTDFSVTQPAITTLIPNASTTFTVTYNAATIGSQTATVNIPNDDADENPYDFVVQGEVLAPEIDIQGNGMSIVDGDITPDVNDDTDFGNTTGGITVTKTFQIANFGNDDLHITGPITVNNVVDFTVTQQPSFTTISPSSGETFTVTYNAVSPGTQTATVNIPNDDADENPFTFTVQGEVLVPEIDIQGGTPLTPIINGSMTTSLVDGTDFGQVCEGVMFTQIFDVNNINGPVDLNITSIASSSPNFTIQNAPMLISSGGTSTFDVQYVGPVGITGTQTSTITIISDDPDDSPFDFLVEIFVNALPALNNQTPSVCEDFPGSGAATGVDLTALETAIGGTNGVWRDAGNMVIATPNNTTVNTATSPFSYEFTDGNNCSNTATVTYTINGLPVLANQSPEVCEDAEGSGEAMGVDLTILETAIGETGGTWTDATSTAVGTPTSATVNDTTNPFTYSYTNLNGCTNTATVTYTINGLPVLADQTPEVCEDAEGSGEAMGVDLTILETAIGGTGGTWTDATSTAVGTPTSATVNITTNPFMYSYTDINGCTNTAIITYTINAIPSVSATGGEITCANSILTLSSTNTATVPDYLWTAGPGGNIVSGATTEMPDVDAPGTYMLVVNDLGNGCSNSAMTIVTQDIAPPVALVSPTSGELTCTTTTINIDASSSTGQGNLTYLWDDIPASTTADITVTTNGTYSVVVTDDDNGCTATASSNITQDIAPPVVLVSPTSGELTCTTTSINIDASGSIGQGNLTYLWDDIPASTTSDITVTTSGTYTVMVTDDDNGCTASASSNITQDIAPPTASVSPTSGELTCTTTSINIDASGSIGQGNLTYLWDDIPASTTADITVTTNGTYSVVVTDDDNGCTASASSNITQDIAPPTASVSPTSGELTCTTTSINIDASSSTGQGNLTYLWDDIPASTTADITVTTNGTYSVVVTDDDNGCTATASSNIAQDIIPPTVVINPSDPELTCTVTSIDLDASGSIGQGNLTYLWDDIPASTTSLITVTTADTYSVTITDDDNGCTGFGSYVVNSTGIPPVAMIATPVTTEINCTVTSITLDASGSTGSSSLTYLWNDVGGSTTPTISVTTGGTYTVTVTDGACTDMISQVITENKTNPTADLFSDFKEELNCDTTSITLDASGSSGTGALSYLWSTTETTPSIVVVEDDFYEVTVTDTNNGCTEITNILITENITAPSASITSGGITELTCTTTQITLDATGSTGTGTLSYDWSTGSTTPTVIINTPDDPYSVTVTDSDNGCTGIATLVITENIAPPTATITSGGQTELTCTISSIDLDASSSTGQGTLSYLWGGGETTSSINVAATGSYSVEVTDDANGCTASNSITISENTTNPTADLFSDFKEELNCDTTSITLDMSGSTGTGALTYLWTTNETTETIEVTTADFYEVTVTDTNNGCTDITNILITENVTAPSASITSGGLTELNCTTTQLTLDATGSTGTGTLSYNWSTGGTNPTVIINTPDDPYSVTVTDSDNGCTDIATLVITENTTPPNAIIDSGSLSELTCTTTSIDLDASVSTGQGTLSYLWGGGLTTSSINVAATGAYSVEVTDDANNCTATASLTITEDTANPTADLFSDFKEELNCDTTSITLDMSGSTGQGALAYLWTTNETTETIEVTTADFYEVTVTDTDNGCTDIANILVEENTAVPTPTIDSGNKTQINCDTTSITLDAAASTSTGPLTYLWGGGETTSSLIATTLGLYEVTVTDSDSKCSSNTSISITENSTAPVAVLTQTGSELNCDITSITLDASTSTGGGTLSFEWSTGETTPSIVTMAGGSFDVTVTDITNNCTSTDDATTITQTGAPPTIVITPSSTVLTCAVPSITLDASSSTGSGALGYLWSNGQTSSSILVSTAATYTVTVTDLNSGCDDSQDEVVTQDPSFLPVTLMASDLEVCDGENVIFNATGGTDFEFFVDNVSVQSGTSPTYSSATLNNGSVVTVESTTNTCSNTSTPITMVVFDLPIANLMASNTTICAGDNVDFVAEGGDTYEFMVNGNVQQTKSANNTFSTNGLGNGVEVTVNVFNANDCSTLSAPITMTVNNLPSVQLDGLNQICEGDVLEFTASGGVEYTFSLNNAPVQGPSAAVLYSNGALNDNDVISVTVTDGNGCSNEPPPITVNVSPVPTVTFGVPADICGGSGVETVLGNVSPLGGVYSGIGVTDNGNGTSFDFDASLGVGTYSITYTYDSGNGSGCEVSASQDINVLPVDNINITQPADLCLNEAAITLNATPAGGSFTGQGVTGNLFDPSISGAGTFDVTYSALSGNGCPIEDMVQVVVNALPTVGLVSVDCAPDFLTYTAVISSNATTIVPSEGTSVDNMDGTFTISGVNVANTLTIVANRTGCTDQISVNPPNCSCPLVPEPASLGDIAPCSGAAIPDLTVDVSSIYTVDWYDAVSGGTLLLAESETYSATAPGTYYAETRDPANGCISSTRTAVELNILTSPTVSFTDPTDVCDNVGLVNLTGIPANGIFTGMGVTGSQFDPTTGAGNYTLTYTFTDGNGCIGEESQDLEVFESPMIDFTDPTDACLNSGNLVPLMATPSGGVFSAPIGVLGNDFDPASSGVGIFDITYTVSNGNGCTSSAMQNIEVFLEPTINFTNPGVLCTNGDPVALSATPAGGVFTGTGITGTQFDPAATGEGTFPITYTFNSAAGCMAMENYDIVVSGLPVPVITGETDYCEGETLDLDETSGTAATWKWKGPDGLNATGPSNISIPNFTLIKAGTYEVVATNANGCSDSTDVNVTYNTAATIVIDGNTPTCTGTDLNISETGGDATTWNWTGPNSFAQNSNSISFTNVTSALNGTYNLTGENANGCPFNQDITILVYELPPVSLTTNGPICANEDLQLTETEGIATNFTWSGPDGFTSAVSNPQITGATTANSGTYSILVSDANNCENSSTIEAIVNPLPAVQISTSSPICNDENLEMAEISGTTTQWTWTDPNGQIFNTKDFIVQAAQVALGSWSVLGTDANGCSATDQVDVSTAIGEDIETQFLVGSSACAGETLIFLDYSAVNDLGQATFIWDFGNGQTSNDRDAQLIYTVPGLYDISVNIQSGNCPNVSIQKQIEIIACLKEEEQLRAELSPSLNSGAFNVKAEMWAPSDLTISILDLSGGVIETRFLQNVEVVDEPFEIPRSGTYFVHLRHWDGTAVLRTIVVKE